MDGRVGRFVLHQGLLNPKDVECRDVAAVRSVLNGGPHLWLWPHPKIAPCLIEECIPPGTQSSESGQQCLIVVPRAIEAASGTDLMLHVLHLRMPT